MATIAGSRANCLPKMLLTYAQHPLGLPQDQQDDRYSGAPALSFSASRRLLESELRMVANDHEFASKLELDNLPISYPVFFSMCPSDCPCATLTFSEVVPYRENESCPTDEELIYAWWQHECEWGLTWWAERVRHDGRYAAIVEKVQSKWPTVAVWQLQNEAILAIGKKPADCYNVAGIFHTILRRKAYRASGIEKKTKEIQAVETMDFAEIPEVLNASVEDPHRDFLDDCLEQLPEKERKLTLAHYYDHIPLVDLAKTLHKSYSAIAQQLSRTRTKLRKCIDSKA